jgi:hypothetical protein
MQLKQRLTVINANAWHYRLATRIWGERRIADTETACGYWCGRLLWLPLVPFVAPFLAVLAGAMIALTYTADYFCLVLVPRFFGFRHEIKPWLSFHNLRGDDCLPYKHKNATGDTIRFAPYQYAWPLLTVALTARLCTVGLPLWGIPFVVLISVIYFTMIWVMCSQDAHKARLRAAWHRICPDITYAAAEQAEATAV